MRSMQIPPTGLKVTVRVVELFDSFVSKITSRGSTVAVSSTLPLVQLSGSSKTN